MSKILIVSDSHGMTNELRSIRERHQTEADLMIHCGDSQLSADDPALTGYVTVRGNCDMDSTFPLDVSSVTGGKTIYATHGHKYSVKTSLMNLYYRAREVHADIVCFGHSHVLGAEVKGGILFVNPGSILLPRGRREQTYVLLNVLEEKIVLSVFDLQGKELTVLSREFSLPIK